MNMLRNPVSPQGAYYARVRTKDECKGSRVAKAEKSEGPERMHEDREESGQLSKGAVIVKKFA
jgi:hypothetical protein